MKADLRKLLHGEPLTDEERERHIESGENFHIPAIVHRTGGVSANLLNTCGICGAQIVPGRTPHSWVKVADEEADRLRRDKR